MSPRNFARIFLTETGLTPAKYVERARLERARRLVEETRLPLSVVCSRAGFDSLQTMRRAFGRWLGVTPGEYALRFGQAEGVSAFAIVGKTGRQSSARKPQPWLP